MSYPLPKTPDAYDLALAERDTQTDTIDHVTALIEASIQVIHYRHSYLEAA